MKEKNWLVTVLSFAKSSRKKMILSVICAVISVLGGIIPYFGISKIIILFFDGSKNAKDIMLWSAISLGGYFIQSLFNAISTTFSHISAYNILQQMRLKIAERLLHAPLGTVLNHTVGRLKNIAVDEVEKVEIPLAHMIPEASSNLLLSIGIFSYLIVIDWRMALASLMTVPFAIMLYGMVMKTYKEKYEAYMQSNNHINSTVVEYVEGIEVIKAFNQSTSSYKKFSDAVISFRDFTLDWLKSTQKPMTSGSAILPSTLLGTVPVGMYLFMNGSITASNFTTSLILSIGFMSPLSLFTRFINLTQELKYAVNSAREFMELDELKSPLEHVSLEHFDIKLNNVSFAYNNDAETNVLQNMNLEIKEGTFTALVGPSGGGKTTAARLIVRFWDTTGGNVTIGDVNIKDIPLSQLMDTISFVTQDNFLFDCSLKENIRLGKPTALDEEVFAAAKAACCDEFIEKFEKGYDTFVGDAGGKLSGGERQRIAIARAILKNAPIIILDEATAFTDPENEDRIQKSIAELTKGKTLLVIAHRLSTIRTADQIAVMKDGAVAYKGTHEELLKKCPLYSEMWNAHIHAKNWAVGKPKLREATIC
ncbi:ABC transporter ATP-binding protein [Clostridium estertheticum]|uniref:ABC transporter ATP-binding protein n=1 Tax=Clostridium estertheticum TaxID=238834 RepID=UPI001C0DFB37|nr:ABC transporter ATP-binding protein [Clostridium estertheticum]MBU3186309.1 ABC transporter ATP-binding protein/permease [Clostridium estertheticum]